MKCNKDECKDLRADYRGLKLAYENLRERYWRKNSLKDCGYCEKGKTGHWDECSDYNPHETD